MCRNSKWDPERDFLGGPVVKTLPSNAGSAGSIPGRGASIPHASRPKNQNIKQEQCCNKFNKEFRNRSHKKQNLEKRKDPMNLGIVLTVSYALSIFLNYRRGNLGVHALREVGCLFKFTYVLSGRAWIQIQTCLKPQFMLILLYQMFLPFLTIH